MYLSFRHNNNYRISSLRHFTPTDSQSLLSLYRLCLTVLLLSPFINLMAKSCSSMHMSNSLLSQQTDHYTHMLILLHSPLSTYNYLFLFMILQSSVRKSLIHMMHYHYTTAPLHMITLYCSLYSLHLELPMSLLRHYISCLSL